ARILRQVHAVPHRRDSRRRNHGPHHPRRRPCLEPDGARRPLSHHEARLAVRARRLHALSRHERAHPFSRGFRRTTPRSCGMKEIAMSLVHETDYGTPRAKSQRMVTLTIDGASVTVPEGTSIMRAAMEMGTQIPKLCATDMLDAFGS